MYTYGMYTYGMHTYGMYTYGMYTYGMYTYGMYTYGIYTRGFTKFVIKVFWRLQFFIGNRTLNLKFQKARTKIEVVLSLPS